MADALIVSNVVLWVLVLLLAAVVAALMRQVGLLHERVQPIGALSLRGRAAVGEPAPRIEAQSWDAEPVVIGAPDAEGRSTLLFFLTPGCPVCKSLLPVLESVARDEARWLRLVLASDGPRAEHEAFVRERDLGRYGYLLSTELALAHQVGQLPYAVLIDEAGVVRGAGLVNTREHIESLFHAKELGTATLGEHQERKLGDRQVA